jgi:serine/threonine protein kinase
MGEVYKATDTRLQRIVAIKVLPLELTNDPAATRRLEREARAITALSHPHICPLFDIGHQDGTDFLVMEYLEGETLAQRLSRGKLPLDQALRYAVQVADGLGAAHKAGIVHRDLKPGNIMLTIPRTWHKQQISTAGGHNRNGGATETRSSIFRQTICS